MNTTKKFYELSVEEQRASTLAGLQAAVNWFREHPEIPLENWFSFISYDNSKENLQDVAVAAPYVEKYADEHSYRLTVPFGETVKAQFYSQREKVCTKKLVGTKIVPAKAEEVVIREAVPEHEEPIYEWDCPVLMAPAPQDVEDEEKLEAEEKQKS